MAKSTINIISAIIKFFAHNFFIWIKPTVFNINSTIKEMSNIFYSIFITILNKIGYFPIQTILLKLLVFYTKNIKMHF